MTIKAGNEDTGTTVMDAIAPMEGPLNALHVRLGFLVEHFENVDAKMGNEALHMFLSDCLDAALAARAAWRAAWTAAGGSDPAEAPPLQAA